MKFVINVGIKWINVLKKNKIENQEDLLLEVKCFFQIHKKLLKLKNNKYLKKIGLLREIIIILVLLYKMLKLII